MKRFVIIDGNAIIHRAYHALPPLTTKDGTMVNAVYGFTSMLLKVLKDLKPDYMAVSFDVAGGTFRDKVFTGYKAKRVKAAQELYDQIPLTHEVVKAFGIPIYTKEGFEADDVIGTVTREIKKLRNKEITSIIVTGDMDLLQLVDDGVVEVYLLRKGLSDFDLYDEKKVKERFGFGPGHIVDYKALRGDSSDNIPGVPGVGEKTAVELIQKIGGIEEIYKKIKEQGTRNKEQLKPAVLKKIIDGEKSAYMSQELATIRQDVKGLDITLENCEVKPIDADTIAPLFQKFSFTSLLKRLPGTQQHSSTPALQHRTKTKKSEIRNQKLEIITSENFEKFLKALEDAKQFAAKEIVNGKDILNGELMGFVFSVDKKTYHVDLKTLDEKQQKELFDIFADEKKMLVGHDVKQLVKAVRSNVPVKNKLFDVMIASYVINSSTRAHDLPSIVLRELGQMMQGADQTSLFGADAGTLAQELHYIVAVGEKMKKELESQSDIGLFDKIEMALIPVLADMELAGVAVDVPMLQKLSKDIAKVIDSVTKKIWKEAGEEFNVASSTQLRDILFDKMGLPSEEIKKGKTGLSTAASELEKLREVHPIIAMIEEHRELAKLQNTYVDVLPTLINKKTGRIHTSFNQTVASTGRLSSSDPNLQNIPIRTKLGKEVRDAFIAEDGYTLISADYSQIELRIVASLAEDKKMIEIFKHGEDIHRATAARINGVPLLKVTKEMRSAAKEVNFGVLYGMGAYGLSWRAGIPQAQAREFIEKYFSEFAGVKKYVDQTVKFAKEEGYVETLFGRRRYIPELKSDNYQLRSAGERMAINMPIQGTAADLMKMAMIAVYEEIRNKKLEIRNDVRMILQVHDELVLEVKKGLEDEVGEMVKDVMENVAQLRVPVEVHVSVGDRWGELK